MNTATETLLVTGATGFLGGAIAADLLENEPDAQLLFLVRADNIEQGFERLRANVARLEPGEIAMNRLHPGMVICGDLASFPAQLPDPGVQAITRILNAAALASFAWKPEIWTINVEHTTAFARAVATLPKLRRFLYVGTAMISGNTSNRNVQEDEFPAETRQFVPYTRSKAEIERRLPASMGDVPLVIARPSIVVGHTRLGCKLSPSIFWMFRMIHAARSVPFSPANRVDVIPVDYCARALIHLLMKEKLSQVRYHVSAGPAHSCSFREIDTAYSEALGESDPDPLLEFDIADLKAMESRFAEWFGPCDPKRITSAVHMYRAFAGLNVTFDNQRLLAEGMSAPPGFADYIAACVHTGQDLTVAEQMLYEFR